MSLLEAVAPRSDTSQSRSSHRRCSVKKVFLEISQNSQGNTCARISLFKKRPWGRCFPVNFAKFLRTPFLQNTSGRLLLKLSNFVSEVNLHFIIIIIITSEKCFLNARIPVVLKYSFSSKILPSVSLFLCVRF